jgi:hypothetical protein
MNTINTGVFFGSVLLREAMGLPPAREQRIEFKARKPAKEISEFLADSAGERRIER